MTRRTLETLWTSLFLLDPFFFFFFFSIFCLLFIKLGCFSFAKNDNFFFFFFGEGKNDNFVMHYIEQWIIAILLGSF